jgi:hypothetical protein
METSIRIGTMRTRIAKQVVSRDRIWTSGYVLSSSFETGNVQRDIARVLRSDTGHIVCPITMPNGKGSRHGDVSDGSLVEALHNTADFCVWVKGASLLHQARWPGGIEAANINTVRAGNIWRFVGAEDRREGEVDARYESTKVGLAFPLLAQPKKDRARSPGSSRRSTTTIDRHPPQRCFCIPLRPLTLPRNCAYSTPLALSFFPSYSPHDGWTRGLGSLSAGVL